MKSKLIFTFVALVFTLAAYAQTPKDTSVVSIETKSGGRYTGQIVFENKDSIKIDTRDLGIVTIFTSEIIYQNLVIIETNDGNEFIGTIINEDSEKIVLKTENLGEISIPKINIKSKKDIYVQQIKNGKLWFANPQSTRYFWSPNAYGLQKGEGYYQNIWVLWNQFAYGVTNNFSVGGGIIPLFLFAGAPTPVFATAKFSVPVVKDKFNLGAGAIAGTILGEGSGFGILYGLSTFGSHDRNVSVGLGYVFAGGEIESTPLINVNGMFRISSKGYFITENYFVTADGSTIAILSVGGRRIIKKAALDFGLFIPAAADMDVFVAIPWLGFTIPLGKTN